MFTGFAIDHYLQNDKKKTLLQSTKDILSETITIFHVFMRKPVLQICAEQFKLGVEISDRSKTMSKCVTLEFFLLLLILLLKTHTSFLVLLYK